MRRLDAVRRGEEEQDAGEKVKSQRMHIAHAMPGEKVVRKFPRANQEKNNRCEELGVPIQEFVEQIGNDVPERPAIIDCGLAAFPAPMSIQLRSAVFAMRDWWPVAFSSTEKSFSTRRCLFDRRDRCVA